MSERRPPQPPPLGVPPPTVGQPPPAPGPPPPRVGAATKGAGRRPLLSPLLTAVLLALAAGATGFYAVTLITKTRAAEKELAAARSEMVVVRSERRAALGQIQALRGEGKQRALALDNAEKKTAALEARLAATEARLEELEDERQAIGERLEEFERVSQQFRRMIDSGRLQVHFRRGRMIVELPARVLFASGSAQVSDKGVEALREVAKILAEIANKRFIVAGHTDNVPVKNEDFGSNWELSAARAVRVTEVLVGAGVAPSRLVAAGFGPHDPVASNRDKKGRHRNRRIEIILEPQLRELPELER
ncbi:MAG: OmpA family protein [Myxococcales bacterium]|nr:OmpA family protein [Myxococcales bacterium]